VRARPAGPDDLPGLTGVRGAAAADVGDVRVVSVPGGRAELEAAASELRGELMWVQPLEVDDREVGIEAVSPVDIIGAHDRWAMTLLGGRVILVRGLRDAPGRYLAGLR
jgi:hypothetical protein